MKYSFMGKNITVTDALKEKTVHKLDKLVKFLPEDAEAVVTFSVGKHNNKVEVTIPIQKRVLRAEVVCEDMYAALDEVIDVLEKQIVRYKGRLRDRSRKDNRYKDELNALFMPEPTPGAADDNGIRIEKTKRFAVKPMDAEEAVIEMELLSHNFYVFRNGDTDEINVVYKRKDDTYGLIEPEY